MHPDIIPGCTCSTCGGPLWSFPMDVGYCEVICPKCDNAERRDAE